MKFHRERTDYFSRLPIDLGLFYSVQPIIVLSNYFILVGTLMTDVLVSDNA